MMVSFKYLPYSDALLAPSDATLVPMQCIKGGCLCLPEMGCDFVCLPKFSAQQEKKLGQRLISMYGMFIF